MNKLIFVLLVTSHICIGQAHNFKAEKINGRFRNGIDVTYDTTYAQSINLIEKRQISAKVSVEYRKDYITKTLTINSLQYVQTMNQKGDLFVAYKYFDEDTLKGDNIPVESSKYLVAEIYDPKNGAVGDTLFHSAISNTLDLSDWKHIYWLHQRALFYIEADAVFGFSHRFLLSRSTKNDWDNFNKRQRDEYSKFGDQYSFRLGFNLNGRKNSIFLQAFCLHQGFVSRGHEVEKTTGLAMPSTGNHSYDFHYQGLSVGYSYNAFQAAIGPVFDTGIYFASLKSLSSIGDRRFTWGIFVSPGVKFRVAPRVDLRIMPSFYINFRTVSDAPVRTGLTSIGIGSGLRYYVW